MQAAADEYLVNDNRTLGLFIPEENPNRADSIVRLKQEDVALLVENYKGRENIDIGESFDPSHENIGSEISTNEIRIWWVNQFFE